MGVLLRTSMKQLSRTVLYRADTMDRFTANLMRETLTEPNFKKDLASAGQDFDLETLLDTIHKTWVNKSHIIETLLYRKSLDDLCIQGDECVNDLRNLDSQFTRILVSGFDLLFNFSLSELFYRVDSFPEDVSDKCKRESKEVIRDAVQYMRRDIRFNDERKQFEDQQGERVKRKKPQPFKQAYDDAHKSINPEGYTHMERSLLALYRAFAEEYKQFKDDVGLLRASILDPAETQSSGYDSALVRLMGVKEHLSEIRPNRLALRYFLVRDILKSYGDTAMGYELLGQLTSQKTKMHTPEWMEKIRPTFWERRKHDYINIKFGKYGKAITNFAIWNAVAGLAANALQIAEYNPKIKQAIDSSAPLVRDLYYILKDPAYLIFTTALLLGVLDKLPAAILKRAYRKTEQITYS